MAKNEDTTSNREVECDNGHTHAVSDLDKVGMDYKCPECFTTVEVHNG